MSEFLLKDLTRIQGAAVVEKRYERQVGFGKVITNAYQDLTKFATEKILKDCIKMETYGAGGDIVTLRLDVYVLSPEDLYRIITKAKEEALRYARY